MNFNKSTLNDYEKIYNNFKLNNQKLQKIINILKFLLLLLPLIIYTIKTVATQVMLEKFK